MKRPRASHLYEAEWAVCQESQAECDQCSLGLQCFAGTLAVSVSGNVTAAAGTGGEWAAGKEALRTCNENRRSA